MTEVQAPPLCECHGEPMGRHARKDRAVGFRWRCKIRDRTDCAQWRARYPDRVRESSARILKINGIYVGMVGFTRKERQAILDGAS